MSIMNEPELTGEYHADCELLMEQNKKLRHLLTFALEGLRQVPRSWGFDITHVQKIERSLDNE